MPPTFLRLWAQRPYWAACLTLAALMTVVNPAAAQPPPDSAQPSPRLLTVVPPGGKVGTVVELTLSGTDLEEPEKLLFSQPGILAEAIKPPSPPPPDPKKPAPPPPKVSVTKFKVTIPAETPVGIHDLRLVNKWGVSNPRAFVVGDLNEVLEKEPNNDVPEAQRIELNTTVSGVIATPIDVDYYVFAAKKGQRVVFSCLASSIDSRLHPGLEVYNAKGKLVASNRNYQQTDAVCDLTVVEDGDYHVRLFEFTHTQGTAEHFYRLSVSTAPWIDAVFPSVLEPGKATQVTVYGRNLPGGKPDATLSSDEIPLDKITVTITPPADPLRLTYSGWLPPSASQLNGFEYRLKNESGWSNPFLLTFARASLIVDNETVKTVEAPQVITLPCEIAGHVEKPHDRDWYQFTAKKGEVFNIELLSDRIGSPSYMYFLLRNADSKQDIVESTDNPDLLSMKFYSRSEDPQTYKFTVPVDGRYLLLVSSRTADRVFGPRQFYRVRITPEQHDFQLVVMAHSSSRPDGALVGQSGNSALDVFAWRQDGYTGDITLTAEGLPPGVTCLPQTLGGNLRHTSLVLSATADAAAWTGEIKVKGTASLGGQKVVREARSGSILWPVPPQQNVAPLSRIDRQLILAVRDKAPYSVAATIDKPSVLQGVPAQIHVKLTRTSPDFKSPLAVQAQATELPQGFTVNNNQALTIAPDKAEGVLPVVVAPTVPPGTYTIVLRCSAPIPFNKDPKAAKQPVNFVEFSTPVTLVVLPKSVATVALPNPTATAKVGVPTEYVVKLTRLYNYDGEFKVEVVVPPAVKDVTIAAVTVPAGKDEVKLIINVPAAAAPGNRPDLVVKVTALYNGTPIVHEAKFNVNVVK